MPLPFLLKRRGVFISSFWFFKIAAAIFVSKFLMVTFEI